MNLRGQLTLYNAAFIVIIALVVGALLPPLSGMVNFVLNDTGVSSNTKTVFSLIVGFFAIGVIALPIIYSKRQE